MNLFFPSAGGEIDRIQSRLLALAAAFLLLFSIILTLSPAVRLHTFQAPLRWEHWVGYAVWLASYALFHRQSIRRLPGRDPYLLPIIALLTGWGLLTIWRLDTNFGMRQTIWLALSLGLGAVILERPQIRTALRRYKYVLLVGGLLLTALTFIFGTYPGGEGPRLWFGCCGLYLQPSEPLKLLLILYLSAYLADKLSQQLGLHQILAPTVIMAGAAVLLLLAQRDLGTTTLIVVFYTLMIYLASGRRRILLLAAGMVAVLAVSGYFLFDVIRLRVDAWLNPWADPSGRSYQIVQSLFAFASGGVIGAGPGLGSPGLVPVAHSDFVAAAVAEETGLLGISALVLLLGFLASRGFISATRANSRYNRLLAAGITVYFTLQSILIIGGNLRLLPLTGVTLPFVSYGGSSLLTSLMAFSLLLCASDNQGAEPGNNPQVVPFLQTTAAILAGLFAIAVLAGWWGLVRAESLQARQENPRRVINDRYVRRGAILDHSNRLLVETTGQPGSYTRDFIYPPLSAAVGYHNPVHGQTGVERSMDGYLRGLSATPSSVIWVNDLLYNQPPEGLDVRLSIDLDLQIAIDQILGDHKASAVLLQAVTGEVLAMASHPHVDPNRLDEQWQELLEDPNAPLLNRATQGQYPLGQAMGPFIATQVIQNAELPAEPPDLNALAEGCAVSPAGELTWNSLLRSGCSEAISRLAEELTSAEIESTYQLMGLFSVPEIGVPVVAPSTSTPGASHASLALGQSDVRVSPLQMALAVASLSAQGLRPDPRLVAAVRTKEQGWIVLPDGRPTRVFLQQPASTAAALLDSPNLPVWETVATAGSNAEMVWYLAGTLPEWQGAPLALAVAVENVQPEEAYRIGRAVVLAIMHAE